MLRSSSLFAGVALTALWVGAFAVSGPNVAAAPQAGSAGANLKNPVASSPESIRQGQALYAKNCRACHGLQGKGDGPTAPAGSVPANLVDAKWDHGDTDGAIFTTIKRGVPRKGKVTPLYFMEPWGTRMTDEEIWHTVNFIRSLQAKAGGAKK